MRKGPQPQSEKSSRTITLSEGLEAMNRFRVILTRIVTRWHWVMAVMIVGLFLGAILSQSTDDDPGGIADLVAPIVALCIASTVLAQAVNGGELQIRLTPHTLIGLGSMVSTYLWVADAADAHPADLSFLLLLLLLFGVVAVPMIPLLLSSAWDNSQPTDKSSSEDNDDK